MDHLASTQRALYREVMLENYRAVASLACPFPTPALIFQLERGGTPWSLASQEGLNGESPRAIFLEGVLKSEKEHFVLKNIHKQAQDHIVLLSGPQFCGSQEF
ncbi:unnamed protein product [Rangifer tarandus platyrhynchus]|uniref:KRAB domain-containing protein n=2 Tax=Rangifer tarandus platyrhynchus TaxID=3082113 RepID=A0ABN8YHR5_RANTA|nr:unnamed protein product [Rangifer tarandus platyrhynchus]